MANNNDIQVRLRSSVSDLLGKIKQTDSSYGKLGRTVSKTSSSYGKFYSANKKLNQSFQNINKDANRASTSIGKMGHSLLNLGNAIKAVGIYRLGDGLAKAIQSSMDMIETANLFEVSMGSLAVETGNVIDKWHELSGLDTTNIRGAIGTYGLLARSMGMSNDQSQKLSTNTYQLGMDLASLMNVPISQTMGDLRAGLLGQSETVYKYGIDVTEASIKAEALAMGIKKSVRNMGQGEKMALRYAVMLKQTTLAQGDFAKTINFPANQLKILGERVVSLSRAIGSMFIPMLTIVLPYINAFVQALTILISAIATFFGYEPPPINNIDNGFSGIEDGADDATGAVGGTTKALKELKNATLGFDELNVMPEKQEAPSGGGGGGALAGGLGDFKLPDYDAMFGNIKQKSDELLARMKDQLEVILKIIGLIGIAFLSWKISNAILSFLTNPIIGNTLLGTLGNIGRQFGILGTTGLATGVALAGFITLVIARFADLYMKSELFRNGISAIGDIAKWIFGAIKTLVGKVIDIFINLGKATIDLFPESWRKGISDFFSGLGLLANWLELDITDLLITIAGFALLATPFGVPLLIFEALTIAIRGLGKVTEDAIADFDMFADISESTAKKLEPFMGKMTELDSTIKKLDWSNVTINDEIITDITKKLKSITELIVNELDADKNESLAQLEPLRNALGEDAFNELLLANENYYKGAVGKIQQGEADILAIYKKAKDDHRTTTEEENAEINRIKDEMNNTGIKHLTETEVEYNTIMNRLKDETVRISLEQSSEILKSSLATKEQTIADAETQYSTIELSAQRMLDVGAINQEQYQAMIDAGLEAKESTIADAELQYQGIYDATVLKLGETAKYIDETTLDIKTKWDVWSEGMVTKVKTGWDTMITDFTTFTTNMGTDFDIFNENFSTNWGIMVDGIKKRAKDNWEDIVEDFTTFRGNLLEGIDKLKENFGTKWDTFWGGLGDGIVNVMNGMIGSLEAMVNGAIDGINKLLAKAKEVPVLGKGITMSPIGTIKLNRIPPLATGGSLMGGQLFEAGEFGKAEMIGNHQGKTTVMPLENTSFVSAIYEAVKSAMLETQSNGGQIIENIMNLDGEVIYKNQQKVSKDRGYNFNMGGFAR